MLVTTQYLLEQGYIEEDDRDGDCIFYIIPKQYVIRDSDNNTLFSIQDVLEDGEVGYTVLIREDNNDPLNVPISEIFRVTVFKTLKGPNEL